jgi:putative GTP pyrophosphokinase
MSDKGQDEAAFIERWRREEPLYAAWGYFVGSALRDRIAGRVAPTKLEMFLRMPVTPRVKTTDSLVQKAFHRHKGYKDPYDEIEDKVGLRFVVLLSEDIRLIEEDILACPHWDATKARDFEEEREAKPYEFRLSVIALHRSVAHSL